jgi:hypothetical protein
MKFPSYDELMKKYGRKDDAKASPADFAAMVDKYTAHVGAAEKLEEARGTPVVDEAEFADSMRAYWEKYPEYAADVLGRLIAADRDGADTVKDAVIAEAERNASKYAEPTSFVELGAAAGKPAGGCEVCVYVVENKEQHQPFLCRGLKPPQYQQSCVSVLVSLMWWLENEVYWLNYGCQRKGGDGGMEWVKPCPAHAVCSFIKSMYDRSTFCPKDPEFHAPSA